MMRLEYYYGSMLPQETTGLQFFIPMRGTPLGWITKHNVFGSSEGQDIGTPIKQGLINS